MSVELSLHLPLPGLLYVGLSGLDKCKLYGFSLRILAIREQSPHSLSCIFINQLLEISPSVDDTSVVSGQGPKFMECKGEGFGSQLLSGKEHSTL